ncbi:MAG: antitoxin VapB family protein [Rhabdochlamydiaceae bacterium]
MSARLKYIYVHIYTMTKIISLTNEVYAKLKKLKNGRSFSREIDELIEKSSTKGDVREFRKFMGMWSKADAKAFQKEVAAARKNAKPRYFA